MSLAASSSPSPIEFTQEGRSLVFGLDGAVSDTFMIQRFHLKDELGRLYTIKVDLLGSPDKLVPPGEVLGKEAYVQMETSTGQTRAFSGIVTSFEQRGNVDDLLAYKAVIMHPFWKATLTSRMRGFLAQTTSDILKAVTEDYEFKANVPGTSLMRETCVQYYETDFDFFSRLVEEEGLFYYFEHGQTPPEMKLESEIGGLPDLKGYETIEWGLQSAESLSSFSLRVNLIPGEFTVDGGDLEEAGGEAKSSTTQAVVGGFPSEAKEGTQRQWWGSDNSARPGLDDILKTRCKIRMEEANAGLADANGTTSSIRSMAVGHKFTLNAEDYLGQEYVITRIDMTASNEGVRSSSGAGEPLPFRCSFRAQPADIPFRARPIAPRRTIPWVRSAIVTSADDPDKIGRVKVSFVDSDEEVESHWARVAQPLASAEFGTFIIPRVDDEVLVAFQDGDPDMPVVVGSLYNNKQKPPEFDGTDDVVIRNPTEGEWNEIRLKGEEAGGDMEIIAGKNMKLDVMDEDLTTTVLNDVNLTTTDNDINVKAGNDVNVEAANEILIEARNKLTLKVGDSELIMDGSTITIKQGATTTLTLEAAAANIEATDISAKATSGIALEGTGTADLKSSGATSVEGTQLDLKGTAMGTLDGGPMVEVKGSGMGTFDGGGMCMVKGGMVMIG